MMHTDTARRNDRTGMMVGRTAIVFIVSVLFLLAAVTLLTTGCAGAPDAEVGPSDSGPADSAASSSEPSSTGSGSDGSASADTRREEPEKKTEAPREVAEGESAAAAPAPTTDGMGGALSGTRAGTGEEGGSEMAVIEEEISSSATRGGAPGAPRMTADRAQASGLSAGFADDNKQYGYFIRFLEEYGDVPHLSLPVNERIGFTVNDRTGKPVSNARVHVTAGSRSIARGVTMADGSFLFFPSVRQDDAGEYTVTLSVANWTHSLQVPREGLRSYEIAMDSERRVSDPIPLDILFIMDTTGSMGEEIERLRTTIELIHMNLTNLTAQPRIRFGMVLYKDEGDEYVTRTVPLTADLEKFRAALNLVEASGGGDTPEDLNAALERTIHDIEWSETGIRMAFVITDAPPHLDYGQEYPYTEAAKDAKERGIKIFTVGTGGLEVDGEYVLRQISQFTSGKYIFLTYGERGESEGGAVGSVSHHTGSNFSTDKLEAIIIRFAKEELSYQTDRPLITEDEYFEATRIAAEEKEDTLRMLFDMALSQLVDYSSLSLDPETTVAVLPFDAAEGVSAVDAEYFGEQMLLTAAESASFRLADRSNLNTVMEEMKLQLSGITAGEGAAELGKILNAEVLTAGKLYRRSGQYELFLKFLRVETGEVLSVTKALIDGGLGLTTGSD